MQKFMKASSLLFIVIMFFGMVTLPAKAAISSECSDVHIPKAQYGIINGSDFNLGDTVKTRLSLKVRAERKAMSPQKAVDLVLVLDKSGSMNCLGNNKGDTKIEIAKKAIYSIVESLKEINNPRNRLALISFDKNVITEVHLTDNYDLIQKRASRIEVGGYTSIGGGLKAAAYEIRKNKQGNDNDKKHVIVLISDGEENKPPLVKDVVSEVSDDVTVYTVGIGKLNINNIVDSYCRENSTLDEYLLQYIVNQVGDLRGDYYFSKPFDLKSTLQSIFKREIYTEPITLKNVEVTFYRVSQSNHYASYKRTSPRASEHTNQIIKWEKSKLFGSQRQSFNIDYQAVNSGKKIPLNEPIIKVGYELPSGAKCVESVPIESVAINIKRFWINKCIGRKPEHASLCPGDNRGLMKAEGNHLVNNCSTQTKCEYICDSCYKLEEGECRHYTVKARCGTAHNKKLSILPENRYLCTSGKPTEVVDENGEWKWSCKDICGSGSVNCSATKKENENYTEVAP